MRPVLWKRVNAQLLDATAGDIEVEERDRCQLPCEMLPVARRHGRRSVEFQCVEDGSARYKYLRPARWPTPRLLLICNVA
jgi:hypothetical protein